MSQPVAAGFRLGTSDSRLMPLTWQLARGSQAAWISAISKSFFQFTLEQVNFGGRLYASLTRRSAPADYYLVKKERFPLLRQRILAHVFLVSEKEDSRLRSGTVCFNCRKIPISEVTRLNGPFGFTTFS